MASFLAVVVAIFIGLPLLFFLFIGIVASIGSSQEEVRIPKTAIIEMNLSRPIAETQDDDQIGFSIDNISPLPISASTEVMGLYQITQNIQKAKEDDRVKGIYLNLNGTVQTGWANLSTIREELQ
ncbi:MAG: hypothetical protein AAF399_17970, partial [Bacteroidota bacterium]